MIPVRLTLRNFMCYRDDTPPIDFEGLHTAVLCGENGAGKSALLAAMTYALWGEARENVSDEDLIAQGENDMSVDLEFRLGDQRYRVLRKRSRRNNKGMLTFQVATEDAWRDISGHTVRETQRLITGRLRMDYMTFTNSAFLLQGRADAFTTKTPTERKEILSSILGLGEYDRLAEQARAESRERENRRRELGGQIDELERQIAISPQVERELEEASAELAVVEAELETVVAAEQDLQMRLADLQRQQVELDNVLGRMEQDRRDANQLRSDVDNLKAQLAGYEAVLARQEEIAAGFRGWQQASQREEALTRAGDQTLRLEKEKHRQQSAVDAARHKLVGSIDVLRHKVVELQERIVNRAANEAALKVARAEVEQHARREEAAQKLRAAREENRQESSRFEGENAKLVERMNELKARMADFERAADEAEKQGKEHCPMCGVMLDREGRERVLRSYTADIESGRALYRANRTRVAELQQQLATLNAELAELEQQLKGRRAAESREQDLERSVREAAEAASRLVKEQAELEALQARLDKGEYAPEARAQLREVEAQLSMLAYDPEEHARVRAERARLAPFEEQHRRLLEARQNVEHARATLAVKEEALRQREARFNKERIIEQQLRAALRELPELQKQASAQALAVRSARQRRAEAADRRARAVQRLEAIAAAGRRKAELAKLFEQASYEKGIYDELAKAFGKSGVQAMIIESVMPELQDEANALLGRMTDHRMFLSFETQRQAKTTDSTIETLDIKISDDNGVARRYELFSGGEAFRINFAVRIALSKLLARRAGAQLQTLIIDEGFGSQDGQGRERLIQAIRSVEHDFEKIFIITHIQELKDEFPSRIEVVRTAGGSVVSVN